jgi:hypothetical protein
MQNNSLSTTCPHSESNLHRKIVPDVWPDLIRLKDQLGAFATQLSDVFNHLSSAKASELRGEAYDFGGDHFSACAPGLMHCRISITRANNLFRLFLI